MAPAASAGLMVIQQQIQDRHYQVRQADGVLVEAAVMTHIVGRRRMLVRLAQLPVSARGVGRPGTGPTPAVGHSVTVKGTDASDSYPSSRR